MTIETSEHVARNWGHLLDGISLGALLTSPVWLEFVNGPGRVILFMLGVIYGGLRVVAAILEIRARYRRQQ